MDKKSFIWVTIVCLLACLIVVGFVLYKNRRGAVKLAPVIQMSLQEKKARFNKLLLPAINKVYAELQSRYDRVKRQLASDELSVAEKNGIERLKRQYRVTTDAELLMALKPPPRSIAMAQAAMESSWATSRFFRQANNVFGVWSFDENDARIPARRKRQGKTVWIKKYPSIEASIRDYYRTLAVSSAFSEFRKLKMQTDDPFVLVRKLDRYSEKGDAYGEELAAVIRHNNFTACDM